MKSKSAGLALLAISLAGAPAAFSATSLGLLTFEAAEPGWFSFAEIGAAIATIQDVPGAGGTNGITTSVVANPGSFAGGGIGGVTSPFALSTAGVAAGSATVNDFNNLRGSLDVNLPIGQSISLRLEPGNGGFNERVDLGVTVNGTGAFQNVTFDGSLAANEAQKTTFVNTLNSGNVTTMKFVFSINNQGAAVGSDFVFDNLGISYVPEPSSMVSLVMGTLLLSLRRRR